MPGARAFGSRRRARENERERERHTHIRLQLVAGVLAHLHGAFTLVYIYIYEYPEDFGTVNGLAGRKVRRARRTRAVSQGKLRPAAPARF